MSYLKTKRNASSNRRAIYIAVLARSIGGTVGCGGGGVAGAVVGRGATLAQEIGHAFGRKHVVGCSRTPSNSDPDYPAYGGYPKGSIGEFGYDAATGEIYNPEDARDFMTYGSCPRWISPYTYRALRTRIINDYARATAHQATLGERLHLAFSTSADGIILRQAFHVKEVSEDHEHGETDGPDLSCTLLDEEGNPLVTHECAPDYGHRPLGGDADFFETLEWDDRARRIVFERGGYEIGGFYVPSEAPQAPGNIKVETASGNVRLTWDAGPVGVTYVVRMSPDRGDTWYALEWDLQGNSLAIHRDSLLDGAGKSWASLCFQVIAVSIIRSVSAESEEVLLG
jgi:hypothetical protein